MATRNLVNLYVAVCFESDEAFAERNCVDVLAANSLIALSALIKRVEGIHGKFKRVIFKRDMPHYYGVAHLKLAGEFCR